MKYFLHDTNSFNDEKITELFINFGYEGVGLFYTILERLAMQEKPIKTNVLKSQLKVGKKLEKCWFFMETIGLISSNNGETFNKQLLNYSEKYQIKKEKNKERVSQWRDNQSLDENVTHYEHVRNTPKVNKSKVNKSKDINTGFEGLDNFDKINDEQQSPPVAPDPPKIEIIYPFSSQNFMSMWANWKEYKDKEFKFKFKSIQSEQAALSELVTLCGGDEDAGIAIIKQSMAKGWKGFFELKTTNNGQQTNNNQSTGGYSSGNNGKILNKDYKDDLLRRMAGDTDKVNNGGSRNTKP